MLRSTLVAASSCQRICVELVPRAYTNHRHHPRPYQTTQDIALSAAQWTVPGRRRCWRRVPGWPGDLSCEGSIVGGSDSVAFGGSPEPTPRVLRDLDLGTPEESAVFLLDTGAAAAGASTVAAATKASGTEAPAPSSATLPGRSSDATYTCQCRPTGGLGLWLHPSLKGAGQLGFSHQSRRPQLQELRWRQIDEVRKASACV